MIEKTIYQIIEERIDKQQKNFDKNYHDYQCDGLKSEYNAYKKAETELEILNLAKAKLDTRIENNGRRFTNTMNFLKQIETKDTYTKAEVEELIIKTINF